MKFWQKIFISVLFFFLVGINVSMFVMMQLFSETTAETEREFAINGAYTATSQLYDQFMTFYRYDTLQYENKQRSFAYCSSSYENKGIYLQYAEAGKVIFNSFPDSSLRFDWENSENVTNYLSGDAQVIRFSSEGTNYLSVRVGLGYPFDGRFLVYIYSMEKYEARRAGLFRTFMVIETIFVAIISVLLYFVIKKVTEPLPRLSQAVTKIAAGKYDERLPVQGKDEIALLSGNINDLSCKIAESVQELKDSAEEKQKFIDDLGHEIRTPLTSISGYAEYLNVAAVTEEEKKQSLDYIISESHRLEHLSNTLLELAAIREGSIEKQEIDAAYMVEYIEKVFQPRCKEARITLVTKCETDKIYSQEELFMMLLGNLIENAIRASKEGDRVELYIRNMRKIGYKKTVITIKDHGIGMKPEEIDRIEKPFYRIDKARSRQSGGVGLGVSLCKQIVKAHEGTMKYDSVWGKGTTVTVVLPEEDNIFDLA